MENRKVKKSAGCDGKRSVQLADFLFIRGRINLSTIGILLCEMSFDNSAVTFLPTAEIYRRQPFSSDTFSRLYAEHKSREIS